MQRKSRSAGRKSVRPNSFTLVELLTVMAIIAILAALTIGAASGVLQHASRSRASAELAQLKTGLDSYKADNGAYPASDGVLVPANYASYDGSGAAGSEYQTNAQIIYQALQGKINFSDTTFIGKAYVNFRNNQIASLSTGAYAADPWGFAYGYSTGSGLGSGTYVAPYNGSNSFDIWTTGGVTQKKWSTNNTLTNAWINNWQ